MNIEEYLCRDYCLDQFISINSISYQTVCNQGSNVKEDVCSPIYFQELQFSYLPKDNFNTDETALLFINIVTK